MFDKDRGVAKDVKRCTSRDASSNGVTRTVASEERQIFTTQTQIEALETENLMEKVCHSNNLKYACKRVMANKGAPGIDGMTVDELERWVFKNSEELMKQLINDEYKPKPVKRVDIPKPGKGVRQLGIPTVIDRLVQQAILQVLTPIIDPQFSNSSFGFRPGRSAHQAIHQAKEYVKDGREIVIDIDLEKFFDKINHDILMARIARRIKDKRILRIIRRFLQAGIMTNGVCIIKEEGTPQGGPLSPFLANILLDDLDKELEKRGHKFCRYADDCNIYVNSVKAGERVMPTIALFLEKRLKLRVNMKKSAVGPSKYSQIFGIPDLDEWNVAYSKTEH